MISYPNKDHFLFLSIFMLGLVMGFALCAVVLFGSNIDLGAVKAAIYADQGSGSKASSIAAEKPEQHPNIVQLNQSSAQPQLPPLPALPNLPSFASTPPVQFTSSGSKSAIKDNSSEAIKVEIGKGRNSAGQPVVEAPFSLTRSTQ